MDAVRQLGDGSLQSSNLRRETDGMLPPATTPPISAVRLVPELRFAGTGGFAMRSADDPVVDFTTSARSISH